MQRRPLQKIKCYLTFKARWRIRSGLQLYENFMRTEGRRSPVYERFVRRKYSGFTVLQLSMTVT